MTPQTTALPIAPAPSFVMPTKPWAARRAAEVLFSGVRERTGRDTTLLPASGGEITPDWLSSALFRDTPGARVLTIDRPGGSVGTTTRAALHVTYNDAAAATGVPGELFVKATTAVSQRLILGLGGFIHGEPAFYNFVRPGVEIEAPYGYYGAVDPRSWRSLVITDDVSATKGATFWNTEFAMTRERMDDLLANLAVLHGTYWNSPRLLEWSWLKTPAQHLQVIDGFIGMEKRSAVGTERAESVLPAPFWGRREQLYAGLRRSLDISSRGDRTYLHGDLHVGNTYLTSDGRMGIADWQIGVTGSWVYDYAYIVGTGMDVEDRRAGDRDLLDLYLSRLEEAGGPKLDREQAFTAYRQAMFYPYFAWAYTIGRHFLMPRYQPDAYSLELMRRTACAIDDLESFKAVGL